MMNFSASFFSIKNSLPQEHYLFGHIEKIKEELLEQLRVFIGVHPLQGGIWMWVGSSKADSAHDEQYRAGVLARYLSQDQISQVLEGNFRDWVIEITGAAEEDEGKEGKPDVKFYISAKFILPFGEVEIKLMEWQHFCIC